MSDYDNVYINLSKNIDDVDIILKRRRTLLTKKDTTELKRKGELIAKLAKRLDIYMGQDKVWTSSDKEGLRLRAKEIKHGYIKGKVPPKYKV